MTTLTEGQHKGEFVVQLVDADRGDISLENGTFLAGHDVPDGTPLKKSGSKLVPCDGSVNSAGGSDETVVGLSYGHYDATNADVKGAYVARLAVVDASLVNFPVTGDQTTSDAALTTELAKLFIISR